MFNLYNNIALLCEKHGTNPTRVCLDAGLSRSTLSNLKNGRVDTLSIANLTKISEVLGEPFDVVAHGFAEGADAAGENTLQALKDEERTLLHSYRTMTEEQQKLMMIFIKGLKNDD